ncbi:hypothetical protein K2173_021905 [Erythroxylum novogranatense]|uniref:Uncharacterized protein n=1 Tax=Erythroxylum novogranatense TaxID=1862640 RepID=A0AAV8T283_9ROSI|nr:hypothetical protein K2173_021905 [Erythroxylum novogranatense]
MLFLLWLQQRNTKAIVTSRIRFLNARCYQKFLSISLPVLLYYAQQIWNDIGQSETEKDRMSMALERECLEVYPRKFEEAASAKPRLHQSAAAKEAELATLMVALGDLNIQSPVQTEKSSASWKQKLVAIAPLVQDTKKKEERMKQFSDIKTQIEKISTEISGCSIRNNTFMISLVLGEHDLSLRRLNDYAICLHQKEKSDRLQRVFEYVNDVHLLYGVLGLDFVQTASEVHPSLHESNLEQSTNISNSTVEGLEKANFMLESERKARLQKLKDIAESPFELWNLMYSSKKDRYSFSMFSSSVGSSEYEA